MMLFLLQAYKNRYTLVIAMDISVTKILKNTVTYCYLTALNNVEIRGKEMIQDINLCGTCCYHQPDEDGEWICENPCSDYYTDYTSYDHSCPDFEDRDERIER